MWGLKRLCLVNVGVNYNNNKKYIEIWNWILVWVLVYLV